MLWLWLLAPCVGIPWHAFFTRVPPIAKTSRTAAPLPRLGIQMLGSSCTHAQLPLGTHGRASHCQGAPCTCIPATGALWSSQSLREELTIVPAAVVLTTSAMPTYACGFLQSASLALNCLVVPKTYAKLLLSFRDMRIHCVCQLVSLRYGALAAVHSSVGYCARPGNPAIVWAIGELTGRLAIKSFAVVFGTAHVLCCSVVSHVLGRASPVATAGIPVHLVAGFRMSPVAPPPRSLHLLMSSAHSQSREYHDYLMVVVLCISTLSR